MEITTNYLSHVNVKWFSGKKLEIPSCYNRAHLTEMNPHASKCCYWFVPPPRDYAWQLSSKELTSWESLRTLTISKGHFFGLAEIDRLRDGSSESPSTKVSFLLFGGHTWQNSGLTPGSVFN